MKQYLLLIFILFFSLSCKNSNSDKNSDFENMNQLRADEVFHTSQYTYIMSTVDGTEQWFAAPAMQVLKGATYYYEGGLEMKNFEGKEINKTFDKITLLVELYSEKPEKKQGSPNSSMAHSGSVAIEKADINVEPPPGGISIAELMKNKKSFKNKVVIVKGMVTKFNPAIMETNWVHIQDGTEHNEYFDLTITTSEGVSKGDIVTFEGKIKLDNDFGYGYVYDVLMEDGKILK